MLVLWSLHIRFLTWILLHNGTLSRLTYSTGVTVTHHNTFGQVWDAPTVLQTGHIMTLEQFVQNLFARWT